MSWTLCTSQAAIRKAGTNANTVIIASGAALGAWSNEAESSISDIARVDLVTNFATLTAVGKEICQKYCAADIAQNIITYDMAGYTSRNEAIMMLNVLENQKSEVENLIKDNKVKTYLGAT